MVKVKEFKKYLATTNYSKQTQQTYYSSVKNYALLYKNTDMESMLAFKGLMLTTNKPSTVNTKCRALNVYNEWAGNKDWHIKGVAVQRQSFIDDIPSESDFKYMCKCLKKDGKIEWYMIIKLLGCTGARISECLKFKAEDAEQGYCDVYGKGSKYRRIYIPEKLCKEILQWKNEGLLFDWNPGSVRNEFKKFAKKYKLPAAQWHPHALRHRFAKSFYARTNNLSLLADLLGHKSLSTTSLYIRMTSYEQRDIVNKAVDW